jgi:MFS family permease
MGEVRRRRAANRVPLGARPLDCLGPTFFPSSSKTAQLLSAFATFAVAFVARPIGSAVFGHFGDRSGRKSPLVASLLVMGLCTTLIGLLPSYAKIGYWAPFLLCVLRFGQGIGLEGEWGGAALLAIENAPTARRAWFGMFPQLGAPIGFIAANGIFLLVATSLDNDQFHGWGWRLPFLVQATAIACRSHRWIESNTWCPRVTAAMILSGSAV